MTRQTYRKTSSEKQNGLLKVQDPFDGYRCFQKNKTSLSFLLLLWVFLLLHLIVFLVEFRKKTMSRLRRKEATLHTRFLLISLPLHFFLDFYSPNFSSSSHWEKGQNSPPPSWYHYLILNFWKIEKRTYVLTFSPKVCATVLNPANYMIMKYFQEEKKKKKICKNSLHPWGLLHFKRGCSKDFREVTLLQIILFSSQSSPFWRRGGRCENFFFLKASKCKGVLPAAQETLSKTNAEARAGLREFCLWC